MAGDFDAIINQVLDQQPQYAPQGDPNQPVNLSALTGKSKGTVWPGDVYSAERNIGSSPETASEVVGGTMRQGIVPIMPSRTGQPLYRTPSVSDQELQEMFEAIPQS